MENFKIVKPFGPSVVKVKIPNDIVNKLNLYIDEVLKNEKKSTDLDHGKNLVGDVTQEFKGDVSYHYRRRRSGACSSYQ